MSTIFAFQMRRGTLYQKGDGYGKKDNRAVKQ